MTGMFNAEHKKAAARLRGYDASKNDPGTVSNAHTNHMPNAAFRVIFFRGFESVSALMRLPQAAVPFPSNLCIPPAS
jgi:hypothetical protein